MGTLLSLPLGSHGEIVSNLLLQHNHFLQHVLHIFCCPKSRASEERQCCPGLTHPALNREAGTSFCWHCTADDIILSSTKASLPCGRATNLAGHAEMFANRVNKGSNIKCQREVGGAGVWLVSARTGCFWQDVLRNLVQSSFKCPWWWGMLGSEFSQSSLLPVAATHSLKGTSWAWEKAELPSSLVQRGRVGKRGNWAFAGRSKRPSAGFSTPQWSHVPANHS